SGCEALAARSGVELTFDVEDDSLRVDVDSATAERIVAPLIENACRYGRGKVAVTVAANGEAGLFTGEGGGPGLTPGELNRVFEPGFRGEAGLSEDHRGAGLGLALARRLARAVGGDVEAVQNGAGGSFRARIPVARAGGLKPTEGRSQSG